MPSAFDALNLFSFDDIVVPVERIDWIGGIRDHVHEYPHQDGGDPERMGRKLNVVRCTLNFASNKYRRYPGLWPDRLNKMMALWEASQVRDLVIPTVSRIKAYALSWTRTMTAKIRSGEMVQVEFREDATNLPTPITAIDQAPASLQTGASALAAKLALASLPPKVLGLFDALQALVAGFVAIRDSADLAGNLIAQKIAQLQNICRQIDGALVMQDPKQSELAQAVRSFWAQCVRLEKDVLSKQQSLQQYVTPMKMTIQAVSGALYGDTSHVQDLLSLNTGSFRDPANIPGQTFLVYYPA